MATAPSNFLSVARVAAFLGGSLYAGSKMSSLQKAQNASDLALLQEFDIEQAKLPLEKRSFLGMLAFMAANPVETTCLFVLFGFCFCFRSIAFFPSCFPSCFPI
jgi:hypothetical protein